jgi:hypothetical protein
MNQTNPYALPPQNTSPRRSDDDPRPDPDQLNRVAAELTRLREMPPTMSRMLLKKTGPAFISAVAFFVVAMILFLLPPSTFRMQLTIGFCGFCIGVVARDLSCIHNFVRWWPANAHFIDWNRVTSCMREGGI